MVENYIEDIKEIPLITIRKARFESQPFFSFVIPTYNRTDLLRFSIQSILNQEGLPDDCEIVISDNCPKRGDPTEIMISELNDKRISYYKNSKNIGGVGNWNRCYSLAQGKWGIMLHDDDMLYPDYLKFLIKAMQQYEDAVAFFPSFNSKAFPLDKQPSRNKHQLIARHIKEEDFLEGCVLACPLGMCVHLDAMMKTGGFNPSAIPAIDYEFYVRLSKVGNIIKLYGYPLGTWRIMDNDSKNRDVMLDCLVQMKKIQEIILRDLGRMCFLPLLQRRNRYFDYQHISFWYHEMRHCKPETEDVIRYSMADKLIYMLFRCYFYLNRHLRKGAKRINTK